MSLNLSSAPALPSHVIKEEFSKMPTPSVACVFCFLLYGPNSKAPICDKT